RLKPSNAENNSGSIKEKLEEIAKEKDEAAEQEEYAKAANLKYQVLQLEKQLEKAEDEAQVIDVDVSDIQLIVEEKTGIPVTKLQADEKEKMRDLQGHLVS